MSESNWLKLAERDIVADFSVSGSHVKLTGFPEDDLEFVVGIGHALTTRLDGLNIGWGMYQNYSVEQAMEETLKGLDRHGFSETRPTDRNCAVRIEKVAMGRLGIHADVRNDFEDKPELEGRKQLRAVFTEVVESLEI